MTTYERFKENHPTLAKSDNYVGSYQVDLRKMYAMETQADALQEIASKMQAFIDAAQIMAWRQHPTDEEAEREHEVMG